MKDSFRILGTNIDRDGLEFISAMEHTKYPFYATQFHPEKLAWEWAPDRDILHSRKAIRVGQYFGNFFMSEGENATNQLKFKGNI